MTVSSGQIPFWNLHTTSGTTLGSYRYQSVFGELFTMWLGGGTPPADVFRTFSLYQCVCLSNAETKTLLLLMWSWKGICNKDFIILLLIELSGWSIWERERVRLTETERGREIHRQRERKRAEKHTQKNTAVPLWLVSLAQTWQIFLKRKTQKCSNGNKQLMGELGVGREGR